MLFGMTLETFTLIHVVLSLIGIGTGFVVVGGMLGGKRLDGWTSLFLVTNVATSVTGYGFPVEHVLPSHIVGAICLVALAAAIAARSAFQLAGVWRRVYVISAVMALYLNVFVLMVQAFLKVPALHALAPKQTEPPFAIAQAVVLVAFVALGAKAMKKFRAA
jgi:hypothetical protein